MNLLQASPGIEYIVSRIVTDDPELNAFLISLGCYAGEPVTIITQRRGGCVIAIKNARYNIDNELAGTIEVEA